MTFILPKDINGEESYNLKIKGRGLGDFSLSKEIRIKNTPTQPKIISPISFCHNAPAKKLTAEGTSLKWYYNFEDDKSFEEIIPNTSTEDLKYFYVSQTSINGCESERSKLEVRIKPPVKADISGDNTILLGDSTKLRINLTGEPPWQLELNNGTQISTISPNIDYYVMPSVSTSYVLKRVNNTCGNGMVSGMAKVFVLIPLGINELKKEAINVYPLPAKNYINIELNSNYSGQGRIEIQNILGQNKLSENGNILFINGRTRLSIANLSMGNYIMKTQIPNQNFINQIIVR
jgi:hypothetical protein